MSVDGPLTEITRTNYRYEWLPWSGLTQFFVDGKKKIWQCNFFSGDKYNVYLLLTLEPL